MTIRRLLTKTLDSLHVTRVEKVRPIVWVHPEQRVFLLSCRLTEEPAFVEYGVHGKVRVVGGGIKVLECFPKVPDDM